MRPGTATSPTAITLPLEAKARVVRAGVNLPVTVSTNLTAMMRADLDRAAEPGSHDSPVQGTTQPKRKGAHEGARGSR